MKKTTIIFIYVLYLSNCLVKSKLAVQEEDLFLKGVNNYQNLNENKFLRKKYKYKANFIEENIISLESENPYQWLSLSNIGFFTYIHLILSFLIIPILSIILILFDMCEDRTIKKEISLPSNLKVSNEYNSFKNTFIIRAKYLFSWFLFKYHYPITNIIFIYHYNHPRYIRLIIYIITILFNTLISAVIYVSVMTKEKYGFSFRNIIISFLFSLIVSIIMDFTLNYIMKFIFEFHEIRREIFKKKLETLRKYIYYNVKKDILFNSKWHFIRNRMITYCRICGPLLLSQVKKNKYQKYVKNKSKNKNEIQSNIISDLISNDSSWTSNYDSNKTANVDIGDIETNVIEKKIVKKKKRTMSLSKVDNKKETREKIKEKGSKGKFRISKGAEQFSFSKYGINNMKLKTVKKIEEIKNRYINKKKDIKFDETMELDKDVKIFENLDIESLEGFTYISTDAMIDQINSIKANSNKMVMNIITGVILILILILINFSLIIIQMGEYNKTNDDKMASFLLFILAEIIFINFIIHRVICLFIALSIHNFYGKKKRNCCYKLIFDIYYEKYIRYLYRIRLLITKYQKEFNFM